jgi:recombinational DNA repair ATPase RecF
VWMGYSQPGQLGAELGQELEPLVVLPAGQLEAVFLKHLQRVSVAERAKGQCLLGPHREDVLLALGDANWSAYRFASQGQQRSLVLALKLAELEVLLAKQGEAPVLLLDDVMAELDTSRQQVLLEQLGRVQQVFLTTTHLEQPVLYPLLQGHGQHPVQVFQVEQACLQTV